MNGDERRRHSTRPLTTEERLVSAAMRERVAVLMASARLTESELRFLDHRRGWVRDGRVVFANGRQPRMTWELLYRRLCGIWASPRYKSPESLKNHLSPGAEGRIELLEAVELAEAFDVPADALLPVRPRTTRHLKAIAALERQPDEDELAWEDRIELHLEVEELIAYSTHPSLTAALMQRLRQQVSENKMALNRSARRKA